MDGDRKLHRKLLPDGRGAPGSRAGAPPIVTAWPVSGPPGTDVRWRQAEGEFFRARITHAQFG